MGYSFPAPRPWDSLRLPRPYPRPSAPIETEHRLIPGPAMTHTARWLSLPNLAAPCHFLSIRVHLRPSAFIRVTYFSLSRASAAESR